MLVDAQPGRQTVRLAAAIASQADSASSIAFLPNVPGRVLPAISTGYSFPALIMSQSRKAWDRMRWYSWCPATGMVACAIPSSHRQNSARSAMLISLSRWDSLSSFRFSPWAVVEAVDCRSFSIVRFRDAVPNRIRPAVCSKVVEVFPRCPAGQPRNQEPQSSRRLPPPPCCAFVRPGLPAVR